MELGEGSIRLFGAAMDISLSIGRAPHHVDILLAHLLATTLDIRSMSIRLHARGSRLPFGERGNR